MIPPLQSHYTIACDTYRHTYMRQPAIERIRQDICQYPVGTILQGPEWTVRAIAERAGCRSPAPISALLDRLARDGYIDRLADPRGSLIEVLKSDRSIDHSCAPEQSDRSIDMANESHEAPHEADRSIDHSEVASVSDRSIDQPACMVHDYSHEQQQHDRAHELEKPAEENTPSGVTDQQWREIRAAAPSYTESDLTRDLGRLASRPEVRSPVGLIISALRTGTPILGVEQIRAQAALLAGSSAPPAGGAPPGPPRKPRREPSAEPPPNAPPSAAARSETETLDRRLAALMPADGDEQDRHELILALLDGADDATARAQMYAERLARQEAQHVSA